MVVRTNNKCPGKLVNIGWVGLLRPLMKFSTCEQPMGEPTKSAIDLNNKGHCMVEITNVCQATGLGKRNTYWGKPGLTSRNKQER